MLKTELDYFNSHLAEWLKEHYGQFVLVKSNELMGFFDNSEDALSEGTRLFGLQAFLIRHVVEKEEEVFIPALALGLINVNS